MYLLSDLDFSLPLKNPVVIFSLVLFIILFAPLLLNRLKIPHIIGLIMAGVVVGPYGLNLLLRDSSIVLFGTVGLLYIMFTAGLEIDLEEFRKNRLKSLVFGIYTFAVPMAIGIPAAYYGLGFSFPSSLLLAGMLASHTLLAYPIASKYGIARVRSVTLTIGGTIITDVLALLVLAAVTGMTRGEIGAGFWIRLAIGSIIFGVIIFLVFPLVARWFFKRFGDHISQYIFVLAMVFLGAFLAELAGLEAIIGAFLSGLALNRFIPHSSALMNRIEFVGNAFFIPFFLISVGMLVDIRVLFNGLGALKVAAVMTVLAVLTKFLAALATQKTFRLSRSERRMVFGLSTARVGATLAVVLVGYNIIIGETPGGEPIRLLNEDVLNGAILMILVTCTISSFMVEKAAQRLALENENQVPETTTGQRMLISLAYPENAQELVEMGIMLRQPHDNSPVYALHIVSDEGDEALSSGKGKRMMEKAQALATASGQTLVPLTRFDVNISNGIIYTIREQGITDVLIGLHQQANATDFLGPTTESILHKTYETILIYKPVQPLNTLKRLVVAVPPKAELEPGFKHWVEKVIQLAKSCGMLLHFYAGKDSTKELQDLLSLRKDALQVAFSNFQNWDDFLVFTGYLETDDLFVIVSSRKGHVSHQPQLEKLPYYLSNYLGSNSFLLLYPEQVEHGLKRENVEYVDSTLAGTIVEGVSSVGKVGDYLKGFIRKKKE